MSSSGGANVAATGPVAVNASEGDYYMDFSWNNIVWYGKRDYHFGLIARQGPDYVAHWDPSNDWSRTGISSAYSLAQNIPVFVSGALVFGAEPAQGTPAPTLASTPAATEAPTPAGGALGDVNGSGAVDIVDALLVAQYYVGLNPANFNALAADVNCSSTVDIVDALLIAQYYVGLIGGFCQRF